MAERVTLEKQFQPTPPKRGETRLPRRSYCRHRWYFNPLPPSGGRHQLTFDDHSFSEFQPTPPTRGETAGANHGGYVHQISTHSPQAGGDPEMVKRLQAIDGISTHSPQAGGDPPTCSTPTSWCNFNPLPPSGGRRLYTTKIPALQIFQPTPPKRGETPPAPSPRQSGSKFQPTPPKRGETLFACLYITLA